MLISQDKTRQLYFTRVAQSAARLVSLGALAGILRSPCEVQEQYVIICGICLHLRLWNLKGNSFC